MKRRLLIKGAMAACMAAIFFFSVSAEAYWVWTPGSKKFVNPKYAAKDSPKEQFDWAMTFYNAKDYQRAVQEFEKVTKTYEYSEYASKAQYYVGLSYENMNKFYIAYQNYQKAIDNFPHIENMDEIVAREFNIAGIYATKGSPKVLGVDIMTSLDRAIEIYGKVVSNAPYGRLAEESQYNMALTMKRAERFDEAIAAFQKILDDYPTSRFVDKAKFEVADCAYKASLKPAYDVEPTAKALRAFEDFSRENRDRSLIKEADKTVQRLKDKAASKSLMTAQFYERQGRYKAAMIYYQDVIDSYPDSTLANGAKAKVAEMDAKLNGPKKSIMDVFKKEPPAHEVKGGAGKPVKAKEEQDEVAAEKKGWTPLKFTRPSKTKAAPAESKPAEKTPWYYFGLGKAKPKEAVSEAAQKKGWAPLKFTWPAKTKEAQPEERPAAKRPWKLFSFTNYHAAKEVTTYEAPPKKAWKPLNFTESAKPKEAPKEDLKEKPEAAPEGAAPETAPAETAQPGSSISETKSAEEDMEMAEPKVPEEPVAEDPDAQIEKSEY